MALNDIKMYNASWVEDSRESFNSEEMSLINDIEVVPSQYGKSARISINGKNGYIPLSAECANIPVGTKLDKSLCMVVHLVRGEQKCAKLLYNGEF